MKLIIKYIFISSLQVTLHLQGMFLFSLIWSLGAALQGDSRKKFDGFFRNIINGTDADCPKPKSIKITKVGTYCKHK
jgi:dynein heavy chain